MEERNDRFKKFVTWDAEILGDKVLMRASFEFLDRVTAQDILSRPYGNQRVRNEAHVDRIVEAMNAGEFIDAVINPIFISNTNKLLDGQHRLVALTHTNKTIPFFVVRGLPEETFVYIDQNKTRSAKDTMKTGGVRNAKGVATTAKLIYQIMEGKSRIPRNELLLRMAEDYPDLEDSVARAASMAEATHITTSVGAALHFLYSRWWPQQCDNFFNSLQYGGPVLQKIHHPITRLSVKLKRDWKKAGGKGGSYTPAIQGTSGGAIVYDQRWKSMMEIHQAFMAYVTNKQLRWKEDQATIDELGELFRRTITLRHSYSEMKNGEALEDVNQFHEFDDDSWHNRGGHDVKGDDLPW